MSSHSIFIRSISSALVMSMSLTTTAVYAEQTDMSAVGRQGQSLGKELINQYQANGKPSLSNNTLTMPGSNSSLSVSDLYPSTSSASTNPQSYYFPDSYSTNTGEYEGVFNSSQGMDDKGTNAQVHLYDDATSASPTVQGAAYKIILDMTNRSRPDLREDPMWDQTRDVIGNIDDLKKEFADCSTENSFKKTSRPVHVPEYERCERVQKPSGGCEITHDVSFETDVIDVYVASQGRNFLTVQFDLKNGSWQAINPSDGEGKVANIPTLDFEQLCQSTKASQTKLIGSWDWLDHGLGGVVDSTVIYSMPQPPTCENGLVGIVQIQDTDPSDDIEYILGGKFTIRLTRLVSEGWATAECAASAQSVADGFCTGTVMETDGPYPDGTEDTQAGCALFSGVLVCPGDVFYEALTPPPSSNLTVLTKTASVSPLQCNFNVGQMDCYTDMNGELQCPYNSGDQLNSCGNLQTNPQCGFISTKCLDGAQGPSGACYINEDTYDCGYTTDLSSIEKDVKIECAGPIRCMGTDCLDITMTQNNDFAKASALLNAAQFMAQDMQCSEGATEEGGDENPDTGCQVFPGKGGTCKKAVGGTVNCCEKPGGISLAAYLKTLQDVPKVDSAIMSLSDTNVFKSSYQVLREPIVDGWTEISKPFSSISDTISSAKDTVSDAVQEVLGDLKGMLKDMLKNMMQDSIQDGIAQETANEAANQMAEQAAQEMAANVASALSVIGTIYTIYNLSMMAIKMIYKCTEDEMTLNVQRELKNCTYIGSYCASEALGFCLEKRESYCCFASPLSRILQEQIRPQLGLTMGDPENPSCGGITMDQISQIDWEKINLDEWMALLQSTGNWPNADEIDINSLTGAGSTFDLGSRVDAEERARARLEGSYVDDARQQVSESYKPSTGAPSAP